MHTPVVLEVGFGIIRRRDGGPEPSGAMVAAAIDGIDDPVVLIDERPVRVDDLLRSLIAQALGGRCAEVLVVHPPEWPIPRVARVLKAVRASAGRASAVSELEPEPLEKTRPSVPAVPRRRIRWRAIAVIAVIAVSAGAAAQPLHRRSVTAAPPAATAVVAEGRITVEVPDGWAIERLTRGPGSPRVKVTSPADPDRALHLTQSSAPGTTLADAAAALGRAAAGRSPFTDFRADDVVAGRPVFSYREVRPGRVVRWVVLLDGGTRISIGCQSRPGAEEGIRTACEQAVRSARELEGTAARR